MKNDLKVAGLSNRKNGVAIYCDAEDRRWSRLKGVNQKFGC